MIANKIQWGSEYISDTTCIWFHSWRLKGRRNDVFDVDENGSLESEEHLRQKNSEMPKGQGQNGCYTVYVLMIVK